MIGRVIGDRYGVTAFLGEGGMGEVYEAEHLSMGRLVAVKVLSPQRAHDREAIARLRHEARVAGTLGHANICTVYDMGQLDDGSPYLVMERLHGETLAHCLHSKGRLPVPELVAMMVQILSGLVGAHQQGIVHHDLKPENIFLAHGGDGPPVPKLLDFGISKSDALEEVTVQNAGDRALVEGTPFYMAPEQARGDRTLDHRVDLWAIGVILYECLSGRRPFDARNYNALLVEILTASPLPLRSLVANVPEALERIVERLLEKIPARRFQTALEVQSALRAMTAVEPGVPLGAARRSPLGSDPDGDESDRTFVFSRAAIGLGLRAHAVTSPSETRGRREESIEAGGSVRGNELFETEDTTGRFAAPSDDEAERTMIDEPQFLRGGTGPADPPRAEIPKLPRKV